ncbi:hypothetical protein V8F20_001614 [Naviculisporaceae sp. PSN 640]
MYQDASNEGYTGAVRRSGVESGRSPGRPGTYYKVLRVQSHTGGWLAAFPYLIFFHFPLLYFHNYLLCTRAWYVHYPEKGPSLTGRIQVDCPVKVRYYPRYQARGSKGPTSVQGHSDPKYCFSRAPCGKIKVNDPIKARLSPTGSD